MASYKLNIATIKGCPDPKTVAHAMNEYALPDTEEFGVMNITGTDQAVFATVIRKTSQSVQQLDAETGELTAAAVEKVTIYPFAVKPASEVLEVYAGSATAIEQVGLFFAGYLALPTVTEPIERDVVDMVERLAGMTERFQLQSIRVSEYAHNSYMSGPYAPKFLDTIHGQDFMAEYVDYVTTARCRFAGPNGRITVNLSPKACFTYSCAEEDQPVAQSLLRKLI